MEHQTTSTLLTWMIFTPLLGAAAIFAALGVGNLSSWPKAVTDNIARAIGVIASGAVLIMGIPLWLGFVAKKGVSELGEIASWGEGLQFVHRLVWIRDLGVEYFVGVDGISISLVLLTALISFIGMLASVPWWGKIESDPHHPHFTQKWVPGYMALLLLLITGMMGTFCAQDMFLFYIFWELMLLPMYFLIGVWGAPTRTESDGRVRGGPYAAIKFFLYTLVGSMLMLLAIIAVYYTSGPSELVDGAPTEHTFNLVELARQGQAERFSDASPILGLAFSKIVFVAFFIGFAIKVPMFPFHTWLPDAHVDAPTPISVILAGVLLKTGAYGILRFNYSMFPEAAKWSALAIAILGAISILYGAFVCMAQKDLKKLIAYSSVSHMGFCLLGFASMTEIGLSGAIFMMIAHGVISPMCFLVAGVVYDRAHTRIIGSFGGLASKMPEYAGITGLTFMASLGLPGLAGFVAEIMVFVGAFGAENTAFRAIVAVSAISVVITAAYYLWTMHRMFLGPFNEKWSHLWDMNWRERFMLYPLAILTIVMGVYPMFILDYINPTLRELLRVMG